MTICQSSDKKWAFLFFCITTLAVHIEMVPSMDTGSCVMGMKDLSPGVLCQMLRGQTTEPILSEVRKNLSLRTILEQTDFRIVSSIGV